MLKIYKYYSIFLITLLGLTGVTPVIAEKQLIKISTAEWSPYNSESLLEGGFLSEIVIIALQKAGYQTMLQFLPWKRAVTLTKNGLYDALIGASYTEDRANYFSYPEYSWKTPGQFFVHKNSQLNYQKIEDLCPARIGVFAGSPYIEELKVFNCFDIQPVATIEQNIKKLLSNRIDVFIETKISVLFYLRKEFPKQIHEIVALSTVFKEDKIFVVFSKKLKNYQQVQADFDVAIKAMQKDGSYAAILKKHGIEENLEKTGQNI